MKVFQEKIHKANSSKYLGDIINKSGKAKENIGDTVVRAVASFTLIRAVLEDIPLGRHRTEIGLELRKSMFLNHVLNNCETWHNIKNAYIGESNMIDNQLL